MSFPAEMAANAVNALSILLAGRNSVHTWWTGILGCLLFGWVFWQARLYADVTLQAFFVITSALGWLAWRHNREGAPLPVSRSSPQQLARYCLAGILVALVYGWILQRFTNAFAPFVDSVVLAFSVLAQLLLMGRRLETWAFWLLVNTIAVPLYLSRELHLTALLYALFWVNALVSLLHWRRLCA